MNQSPEQIRFEKLLKESRGVVYGVICSYCRDEGAKDDLYQEVVASAWLAFNRFRGDCKFSSWIGKIARNISVNRLRAANKLKTVLYENILWDIPDTKYEEEPVGLPLSIMDRFTEAENRTLQMRMDGMSFSEISEATGELINRLIVRMHRLKNLLSKGSKG